MTCQSTFFRKLVVMTGLSVLIAGCEQQATQSSIQFDGQPRSAESIVSGSRYSVVWTDTPLPRMAVSYPARLAVSDNRLLQVVYRLTGCVGQDVEDLSREGSTTTATVSADCRTVWTDDSERRVQVATFNVQATANRLVAQLAQEGISASVLRVRDRGRSFYRVTTEPYRSTKQLSDTMRFVRSIGYRDAFIMTRRTRN